MSNLRAAFRTYDGAIGALHFDSHAIASLGESDRRGVLLCRALARERATLSPVQYRPRSLNAQPYGVTRQETYTVEHRVRHANADVRDVVRARERRRVMRLFDPRSCGSDLGAGRKRFLDVHVERRERLTSCLRNHELELRRPR